MTLPFGLVALLASIFATAALLAYAYETLAVPLTTNILATPILYALLIVSWLGGTVSSSWSVPGFD